MSPKRWGTRVHAAVYRRSQGRLLGRVGGQPVLLLETLGRRSGQRRETPVQYLADGEAYAVVAANAGAARPPAWYLNLSANHNARVLVGPRTVGVRAREVTGEERAALWQRLVGANRHLERTARKAQRELPLLLLEVAGEPVVSRAAHARELRMPGAVGTATLEQRTARREATS